MLARYLSLIQVQRQDFNGRVITIRHDDLRARVHPGRRGRAGHRASLEDLGLRYLGPTVGSDAPPFGVYVHVPFCAQRCDYCAFATWTDRMHLIDPYLEAWSPTIGRAVDLGMPEVTSVFFGGGTPSLVPAEALMRVLDHCRWRPALR